MSQSSNPFKGNFASGWDAARIGLSDRPPYQHSQGGFGAIMRRAWLAGYNAYGVSLNMDAYYNEWQKERRAE